jgi:hypothetical protein
MRTKRRGAGPMFRQCSRSPKQGTLHLDNCSAQRHLDIVLDEWAQVMDMEHAGWVAHVCPSP